MKNVLVFPCGSEIGLELFRALRYSTYFNLIGANSVDDHGKFVYEKYIGGVPFVGDKNFIVAIKKIVVDNNIDYIYPAMDSVITELKEHESELDCCVISSPAETAKICLSKEKTYRALAGVVAIPKVYSDSDNIEFPVFCKPKIGYGARGAKLIRDEAALKQYLAETPDALISEYLTGDEYTVDCFTDRHGKLRFCGARERCRISNGISVSTKPVKDGGEFKEIAEAINTRLVFRGAWFVQLKRSVAGRLTLLEVASRYGGSSALYRAKGINFAQLSLFDAMGFDVDIIENDYDIELDRALDNKYKISFDYNEIFLDYDDTLIIEKKYYNVDVIKLIYQCKNRGVKVTLLSHHDGDLKSELKRFKLEALFDRIIHIPRCADKADYIDNAEAVFIDDSFAERKRVFEKKHIPVFSIDMVETLI